MARSNHSRTTPNILATPSQDAGTDPLVFSALSARFIDVLAAGVLHIRTVNGQEAVYTFAGLDVGDVKSAQAYSNFPYRLEGQIERVIYDGATPTTIDPSDLIFWG